jgi:Chemotaxis response regulator containing a CheY-like receiver domain and a methylesterase domain
VSESETPKPVALLARPGQARERLRQALEAAGARIVLEEDPCALDPAALQAAAPQAVLVALEPAVEDALEKLDPVLQAPGVLAIFDEADLAARREGWEAQRWIRHLAAKLNGHDDVLPPGHEADLVLDVRPPPLLRDEPVVDAAPFAPHLAEAALHAGRLPSDTLPGRRQDEGLPPPSEWSLVDPVEASGGPRSVAPPPLPDFSHLELVPVEEPGASVAGAVLVIAGIGGPDALRKLLAEMTPGFRRPVLVQLRLDGGRYDNLVKQMARVSVLPVAMAMPGDAVAAGTVYVLPDGVGLEMRGGVLRFADVDAAHEPLAVLPPAESAVVVLSGALPARMDAALALAMRGGLALGQALEGCYDANAVKLLAAGGGELGTPAELATRLAERWG